MNVRSGRLRSALLFLAFIALYLALAFSIAAAVITARGQGPPGDVTQAIFFTIIASLPAAIIATLLLLYRVHGRPLAWVGLGREPGWGRELGFGFLLGAGLIAAVVALEAVTGHLSLRLADDAAATVLKQTALFLAVFFLASAHEELVFRGYPFQRLIEVIGAPAAVLLLAFAFGAVHYRNPNAEIVGVLNTALVGVLFGLAYLRTRRLWFPIGLHWGWNFFEAAFGLPVSGIRIEKMPLTAEVSGRELFHGGGYGPEASVMASVVLAVATAALLWWRPYVRGEVPVDAAVGGAADSSAGERS